jgi:hypothetical protein
VCVSVAVCACLLQYSLDLCIEHAGPPVPVLSRRTGPPGREPLSACLVQADSGSRAHGCTLGPSRGTSKINTIDLRCRTQADAQREREGEREREREGIREIRSSI